MVRTLEFKHGGIIEGDIKRDIEKIFPQSTSHFRQRKQYDEYYFTGFDVELEIEHINKFNILGYGLEIYLETILFS